MRKFWILCLLLVVLLTGCSDIDLPFGDADEAVYIPERFFVLQTQQIFLNSEEYLGRTIRYEGIFRSVFWPPTELYYHYVVRYTDDCCGGADGIIGFEVYFGDDNISETAEEDDWVEVTGILDEYEEDGVNHLRLIVTSIVVLDERGAEFVSGE